MRAHTEKWTKSQSESFSLTADEVQLQQTYDGDRGSKDTYSGSGCWLCGQSSGLVPILVPNPPFAIFGRHHGQTAFPVFALQHHRLRLVMGRGVHFDGEGGNKRAHLLDDCKSQVCGSVEQVRQNDTNTHTACAMLAK